MTATEAKIAKIAKINDLIASAKTVNDAIVLRVHLNALGNYPLTIKRLTSFIEGRVA